MWGLKRGEARQLVLKAPKILAFGLVETMDSNLQKLADGFACDKAKLVAAAKMFPPLAYQNPERLIEALKHGAVQLGVPRDTLAAALLRSPSLMARRPEGWRLRMRFVIRIARALGTEITAGEVLEKFPQALTYGPDRLLQRYAMARLGIWTMNWTARLTLPDARARILLEEHFRQRGDTSGMRQALARRKVL